MMLRTRKGLAADRVGRRTPRPLYRRVREDKGYVMALTGLLLIPLMAFTAMAVDLGSWYAQATRIQRAADAAVLAGVVWAADSSIDSSCTPAVAKWNCVAIQTAKKNGMDPSATPGMTMTVTKISDSRINVTIKAAASLYFAKVFLNNQNLTRSAEAEYITPVPMGSPLPGLGNDPDHPVVSPDNPTGQPQFWLNIAGQNSPKSSGDRFTSNTCKVGEWGCSAGGSNSEYQPNGYIFKVRATATVGQPLNISIYDPAFTNTGDYCEQGNLPAAASPQLAALVSAYPSAAADAANRYVRSTGAGNQNKYCTGDNNVGGTNIVTTYIVRAPDGTPLDSTDNTAICAVSFSPEDQPVSNLLLTGAAASATKYGLEQQLFANHFHKDFTICKIANPVAGDYIVQIKTNALNPSNVPPTTIADATIDSSVRANIAQATNPGTGGHNRYTIDSFWGGSCCTNAAGLSTFAEGKLPMYVNVAMVPSTTNFYLAKITPQYAGKILQLNFWDIADGGTAGIRVLPPTETPVAVTPTACTWTRDATTNLGAAIANGCAVTNMVTGDYNAKLVQVTIPLPNGYTCDSTAGCWFKIAYTFTRGNPNDTTTWSANILGDPVHLAL
jgi:Flp pilus assembly protein TadG